MKDSMITLGLVGHRTGGAWVWNTTKLDVNGVSGAQLQNACTMQERCMIIEKLGGKFYADLKDCPFLDLP